MKPIIEQMIADCTKCKCGRVRGELCFCTKGAIPAHVEEVVQVVFESGTIIERTCTKCNKRFQTNNIRVEACTLCVMGRNCKYCGMYAQDGKFCFVCKNKYSLDIIIDSVARVLASPFIKGKTSQ